MRKYINLYESTLNEAKLVKTDSVPLYLNPSKNDINFLISKYRGLRAVVVEDLMVVANAHEITHDEMFQLITIWVDGSFNDGLSISLEILTHADTIIAIPGQEMEEDISEINDWPIFQRTGLTVADGDQDG